MNIQGQEAQGLENVVSPADVVPLVAKDQVLLRIRQCPRQIDFRAEESDDKRRLHIIRNIGISGQRQSNPGLPADSQIG